MKGHAALVAFGGVVVAGIAVIVMLWVNAVTVAPASSAAPASAERPAAADRPVPAQVAIPALGITDDVVSVGLNPDRTMAVPPVESVGWYEPGISPGELGPAVLAGHVNYAGVVGSFARIGDLRPGDTVQVTMTTGEVRTFEVYDVLTAPKSQFPTAAVWGDVPGPELRLVTCSGDVVDHSYTDNTVVRARAAVG